LNWYLVVAGATLVRTFPFASKGRFPAVTVPVTGMAVFVMLTFPVMGSEVLVTLTFPVIGSELFVTSLPTVRQGLSCQNPLHISNVLTAVEGKTYNVNIRMPARYALGISRSMALITLSSDSPDSFPWSSAALLALLISAPLEHGVVVRRCHGVAPTVH